MVVLELSSALESPNKRFKCSFNCPLKISEEAFMPHKISSMASVKMNFYVDLDGLLHLEGNIRVPCEFMCDRCGASFEKNLFIELNQTVSATLDEEDEFTYKDGKVALDPIIEDNIILSFPSKVLCREDCKGICQNCGMNLNDQDCICPKFIN